MLDFGVREYGLVPLQLSLSLEELNLKRPWIDFGQEIAGCDQLALANRHIEELAVNACPDRDRVQGRHRSQSSQVNRHAPGLGTRHCHGH